MRLALGVKALGVGGPPLGGGNWWDPDDEGLPVVAAWQAKGVADYAASKVNLANPGTYNLTEIGAGPSWTVAGWATFTAGNFLRAPGVVPGNGWSLIGQFADCATGATCCLAGSRYTGTDAMLIFQRSNGGASRAYYYGTALVFNPPVASGNMAIGGTKAYLNGVAEVGSLTSVTTTINDFSIGGLIGWGYAIEGTVIAVAIYNATLTAPQVGAVAAAMAAL